MAICLTSTVKYVPECERKEKKPATFHIKLMTAKDRREYYTLQKTIMKKFKDESKDDAAYSLMNDPGSIDSTNDLIASHVTKIDNLVFDDVAITDGKAFTANDMIPTDLVNEIYDYIVNGNTLTKDEVKN